MGSSLFYEKNCLEEKVSNDFDTACSSLTIDADAINNGADNGCLGTSGAVQLEMHKRERKGNAFSDLDHNENYCDDDYDEEDDSDWEPINHFVIKKWFCRNCTMPNFDDVCHCDV